MKRTILTLLMLSIALPALATERQFTPWLRASTTPPAFSARNACVAVEASRAAVTQERDTARTDLSAAAKDRDAAKAQVTSLQRAIENLLKQVGECAYARASEAAAAK